MNRMKSAKPIKQQGPPRILKDMAERARLGRNKAINHFKNSVIKALGTRIT